MTFIFVFAGRDRGKYYEIESDTVVVGRDESCDLQIIDEMVSRNHMQFRRDGEGDAMTFHLSDMGSANGVKVNGNRLSREVVLRDGDRIEIGESKLLFTVKQITDLDTALASMKERGQHGKNTIIQ